MLIASLAGLAQTTAPAKPAAAAEKPLTALPYTPSLDLNSMDTTADPCADFYQFTCGGWMKHNPIPGDQANWSVYGKLANDNYQFLWGILDDLSKSTGKRTPVQKQLGDFFGSCMDEPRIEALGAKPLEPELKAIARIRSAKELLPYLAARNRESYYYGGPLFTVGSAQDFGDASSVIASLEAGGLGLPDRDYYFKTDAKSVETRAKYAEHVANMLVLIGEKPEQAKAAAAAVLKLETGLAGKTLTLVEKREPHNLYHKMTPAELKALVPAFDWDDYFKQDNFPAFTAVNVDQPEFFKLVNSLLEKEDIAIWRAYLRWNLVRARSPYLSRAFVDEDFAFYRKYLRGTSELAPRWKRCVQYADHNLGDALGQEFVRRTFTGKTKEDTVRMTQRIEGVMEQEIKGLDWMSPETKEQALIKLHGIRNKVGYPDKWRDYSSVNVAGKDFAGNVVRLRRFETNRQIQKIGKPLDRNEWMMSAPTVNAYYDPQMNDINFPAGVLQPPLYDPKMDDAPNYGNTGSTIGHELTHGFDDEGRQFDANGNLKDWWSDADAKKFEEKINCVRDQFATYTVVDDIKINSKLTSGEDVADLGGTLLAYIAWKEATKDLNLAPRDGYTPDQRFFIGFAQWACENVRPEASRLQALTNPHSPGKYRINGIVADLPEFQKAFGCKAGQPMVSPKACRVW
ncbi:MAG: M13 family metallopeptidase [Acidobacteriota bacterium]|nr:M13 family metallopeptidase [Acidobacteriota bacterium]